MIFIIDDDRVMAECVKKAALEAGANEVLIFDNVIAAMDMISEGALPELILMEVMLTGPDGFSFLNELVSYPDTAKIPVVLISDVDFSGKDLSAYGVVGTILKETMMPEEVLSYVRKYVPGAGL